MSTSRTNPGEHGGPVPLPRGTACRACRRRKQKCSGGRPICQQCTFGNRHHECQWDPAPLSKTEKLEARVRELEELVELQWGSLNSPGSVPTAQNVEEVEIPPPDEVLEHLIDVFFAYSYQFDFPGPAEPFRRSLSLPSTHPDSPHQALRDAICLVACRLSNRNLIHLEPYFLGRATSLLDESLSMVDRLLDFIIATTLVSRYCFYVGHDIRGTYMASSAASFAVSCGLHALPSQLSQDGFWPSSARLIAPPESVDDLNHLIRSWWAVFLLDRDACNVTGPSSPIPEENVSTPWPYWFSQFEDASNPTLGNAAVSNVADHTQTVEDMHLYVKVKASALLNQAAVLARDTARTQFGTFWPRQRALNVKLNAFILRLPPVTATSLSAEPSQRSQTTVTNRDATRYTLLHAYSCCFAAKMQLHGVFAPELPNEYSLLVEAAKDMANVVRTFGNLTIRTAPFFAAPHWITARDVLQRETQRLTQAGLDTSSTRSEVDLLTTALDSHAEMFPGLRTYLRDETD